MVNLQVITEAMSDFDASSSDALLNQKVQRFDFQLLADKFDQAGAPSAWALTHALLDAHLAAADTESLGGDLAYRYGLAGALSGTGVSTAQGVIGSSQFGSGAQTLQPLSGLQEGLVKLS